MEKWLEEDITLEKPRKMLLHMQKCLQSRKPVKKWEAGAWKMPALFVTLEPCPMCSGAMILSRVAEVYFGAYDPKGGTAGTLMNLLEDERFNHQAYVEGGILEDECGMILTDFFRKLRQRKKKLKKDWSTNEK
jgi:tRNA(adenine34) deaminase